MMIRNLGHNCIRIFQVPGAFCEKIVSYSVTVLTGNTKILDRVYDTNAEKMVTVDAEGFTRYSVKMTATNNANIVSDEREKLVSTPKTGKSYNNMI